ncbi:MAG: alpha-glucan family phosphorylase [Bacteroidales bacterium]|nr:alpha-glucan family phosphorylase [Bacteroidales bacterium]
MDETNIKPDYVFEISWEACNKIGGIYTVVSTKVQALTAQFGDNYILIGPDVWKETHAHPEFTEDKTLFSIWRDKAEGEGLRLRAGRWNVPGNPIVILVDFTPYFTEKDLIFAKLWETYKLDSISGQWDYIEPALFGYAAGKAVESFYNFYLSGGDRIIAHFHEWMTGAGILYLREYVPQVGCIFTTHATVMGRSAAGNNLPLYDNKVIYDIHGLARQFGVVAKSSLERKAAQQSDAFTTVSRITAAECEKFIEKTPDVVTPNGFDEAFLLTGAEFENTRREVRQKLARVAEALFGQPIEGNAFFVLTSGRYEYRNKGLDLFIDALAEIDLLHENEREIIAVIAVPGNHAGARKDILHLMDNPSPGHPASGQYLTHLLYNQENDLILQKIRAVKLMNSPDRKVKVMFVPAYLDEKDGVFNLSYYQFLTGFDLTVFPSYYEPWGYTPLESVAFGIPAVTTSLAGFGLWVNEHFPNFNRIIRVIERSDLNYDRAVHALASVIVEYLSFTQDDLASARAEAAGIRDNLSWKNLIVYYNRAFGIALARVEARYDLFGDKKSHEGSWYINGKQQKPEWNILVVQSRIPEKLESLKQLANNVWWTWNYEAVELFEMAGQELWELHQHNPISMLENLNYQRFLDLESDNHFMEKMKEVVEKFEEYLKASALEKESLVAYFSMEYGFHESMKTYSGGLGILAGDYLKEASDTDAGLIAVGLIYKYGYFQQNINLHGDQIAAYSAQDFNHLPVTPVMDAEGNWVTVGIALPGRKMTARAWKLPVGRITLYLLDTDFEGNSAEDRAVTHQLYGGDWQNRFKQELLLGVGGIRLLETLGIQPDVLHLNEGHAAFAGLERLRIFVQKDRLSFHQALEAVRSSTLFTTHTPVPAGHDAFTEDILRTYIPHYAERLNISWDDFMNLGRMKASDMSEKFSMSILAARLSQEMNGVSRIHGKVTRSMFAGLYPGYFPGELHIGHVTNGVHYGTWTAKNWQKLYDKHFGKEFAAKIHEPGIWKNIHKVTDKAVWDERVKSKALFVDFLRKKTGVDLKSREENPRVIIDVLESIDEKALFIGFARRFATYKRAHLLFTDVARLKRIVNNDIYPVRFIFAGKAHPNDKPGQDLIKRIISISKDPAFTGRLIFLDNYDMGVARNMVSGVDIWLNTPTRPLEASGTSGEKAVLNGVLNLSVLDGWWAEGYRENAGWAITEAKTYANQQFQDELDAETIYSLIEDEIVPAFFDLDKTGIPHKWVSYIKNNIAEIAPHYIMRRMMNDYQSKYYEKLIRRSADIRNANFRKAREIEAWKQHVLDNWDDIEVVSRDISESGLQPLNQGDDFSAGIVLNVRNLRPENIGVELIFSKGNGEILFSKELDLVSSEKKTARYTCRFPLSSSGIFNFAFRIFPKADFLPHRQDFGLVKWA